MADVATLSSNSVPAKGRQKNLEALEILRSYVHESEENQTRKNRITKNEENYREFRGDIDWDYKARGQSREHL